MELVINLVQPQISAPIQLIGAKRKSEQSLSCIAEASPKPINYWTFGTGEMIVANEKFIVQVCMRMKSLKVLRFINFAIPNIL